MVVSVGIVGNPPGGRAGLVPGRPAARLNRGGTVAISRRVPLCAPPRFPAPPRASAETAPDPTKGLSWLETLRAEFNPLEKKGSKIAVLDFEKPLIELDKKIAEVRRVAEANGVNVDGQIQELTARAEKLRRQTFSRLEPMQRLQVARHPNRPTFLDIAYNISDKFVELHGDRAGYDDPAVVCGLASMDGQTFLFIGQQKGRNTKENVARNFGMPQPNGYRKALRFMRMADQHGFPIVTFVDTPGAFAGKSAEELGQGEAIAVNLREMFGFGVPIISLVIGEGGSGGALAIGCANRTLIMENAVYYVASPEACAAILWKSASEAATATAALRITPADLVGFGVMDRVVPEPPGASHYDPMAVFPIIKRVLLEEHAPYTRLSSDEIRTDRYQKFRKLGQWDEWLAPDGEPEVEAAARLDALEPTPTAEGALAPTPEYAVYFDELQRRDDEWERALAESRRGGVHTTGELTSAVADFGPDDWFLGAAVRAERKVRKGQQPPGVPGLVTAQGLEEARQAVLQAAAFLAGDAPVPGDGGAPAPLAGLLSAPALAASVLAEGLGLEEGVDAEDDGPPTPAGAGAAPPEGAVRDALELIATSPAAADEARTAAAARALLDGLATTSPETGAEALAGALAATGAPLAARLAAALRAAAVVADPAQPRALRDAAAVVLAAAARWFGGADETLGATLPDLAPEAALADSLRGVLAKPDVRATLRADPARVAGSKGAPRGAAGGEQSEPAAELEVEAVLDALRPLLPHPLWAAASVREHRLPGVPAAAAGPVDVPAVGPDQRRTELSEPDLENGSQRDRVRAALRVASAADAGSCDGRRAAIRAAEQVRAFLERREVDETAWELDEVAGEGAEEDAPGDVSAEPAPVPLDTVHSARDGLAALRAVRGEPEETAEAERALLTVLAAAGSPAAAARALLLAAGVRVPLSWGRAAARAAQRELTDELLAWFSTIGPAWALSQEAFDAGLGVERAKEAAARMLPDEDGVEEPSED